MTEASLSLEELDAFCRLDLGVFTERVVAELDGSTDFEPNWHIDLVAAELMAVASGENRRLLVNLPPRGLKSILTSISYVAWMLGHRPSMKFLVVSYGSDLAEKLARDCIQVMRSEWYMRMFPATRLAKMAASDFETTAGGGRMGRSIGGAITGRGADSIVVDDIIKPEDASSIVVREQINAGFGKTLVSRLNNKKNGSIIVVGQRLHQEDLSAKLIESKRFKCVVLPAIAVEDETWEIHSRFGRRTITRREGEALHAARESLEELADIKALMGAYEFSAQYQQAPLPADGAFVNLEACPRYEQPPDAFDYIIHSWDTASKATQLSDYSVCTVWGIRGRCIYLLATHRQKMDYPRLKALIAVLYQQDRPRYVLIEDSSSGQALIQELKLEGVPGVVACKPQQDKTMRLMTASALLESGRVYLPRQAPWLDAFLTEVRWFPHGQHDDQVDSMSQALNYIRQPMNAQGWFDHMKELAEAPKKPKSIFPPDDWS